MGLCPSLRWRGASRDAFTLVELMVVIAVMGVLMSLLMVAVQASRESARRMSCVNNLRNQAVAGDNYCSAHQRFPPGRKLTMTGEVSWCFESLPFLDQGNLYSQFDRSRPWNDKGGNLQIADARLPVFRCASATTKFDGKTDYGGITGSLMLGIYMAGTPIHNGMLVEVGSYRSSSVTPGEVTDGLSNTLLISEATDRPVDFGGRWISGYNCISQDDGGIGQFKRNDIFSNHPNGANAAFADGSVRFLSKSIPALVIGALCTRGGGETIGNY